MASMVPGYEYDIFISYRQKDNKGDRWVSEFVEALKDELESTFKDEISVYFDINPHDGLLETHDVGASLKEKLRCLVFIPIISRTYCDPKSFAWEHELKPFVEQASQDQFGLKVKLHNGNVASRVLPVRIHDLDFTDIKLCESVLGGVLRGVEFIYKEPGVNKPLTSEDDERKNLNNTKYRIQINKIALAIKEIILGLKTEPVAFAKAETQLNISGKEVSKEELRIEKEPPVHLSKLKLVSGAIIIAVIIAIVLAYPKVFQTRKPKVDRDPNGKISIAVNKFDNLTGDTILNYWGLGIQELLINNLGNSDELSVQNSQTIYEVYESIGQTKNASVIPSLSREAAIKLKAGAYITGSYQKTGNKIIMLIKLSDTQDDGVLWTSKIYGSPTSNYTDLADSLSKQVKDFLEIKSLEQKTNLEFREAFSNSPEAYRKYIKGMNSFMNADYISAIQSYKDALEIDSTFTLAAFYIANAYNILGGDPNHRQAAKWTQRAFKGKERLSENYQYWVENWEAFYITKNSKEVLTTVSILENSEIRSRYYWLDIGCTYILGGMYDKAVKAFEKVEAINSEWGGDWKYLDYYTNYGNACHHTGNHKKEAEIFETGLEIFPDNMFLLYFQAICTISENDTEKASGLIRKLIQAAKKVEATESQIESGLGTMYQEANSLDKAEEHYRSAVQIDPSDPLLMNDLASFLIRHDRNVDEGMKLIKRALEILPGKGSFLMTQGRGYYKQGKFEEAYSILNVAKDSILTWNADLNKQIQDAKNAVANQRNRRQ